MSVTALQPFEVPLRGVSLVEAAAGTGKTWTISALYLRLVLESDAAVPNILVVTYTRAATGELKERLRTALTQAIAAFEDDSAVDDPLLAPLLLRYPDRKKSLLKLRSAVAEFDQAAIFTIHSFCERVLSDSAFQSAMTLDNELLLDEESLRAEVLDDLWRRDIYPAGPIWTGWLAAQKKLKTADDLSAFLKPVLAKPYLRLVQNTKALDLNLVEQSLETAFKRISGVWHDHRDEVSAMLLDKDAAFNRTRFPLKSMPTWIFSLESIFSQDLIDFRRVLEFRGLEKLSAGFLSQPGAIRKGELPPRQTFFDEMDRFIEVLGDYQKNAADYFIDWIADLRFRADQELNLRKRQQGVQGYDDLLLNLHHALHSVGGEALCEKIRATYQVAMLDEFQDTDPVQYEIFKAIYSSGTHPVFLVGDPKQAIYSFRGADIFAYIRARNDVTKRFTLQTNHRAAPGLVRAVNALFSFRDRHSSFVFSDIPFEDAQSAGKVNGLQDAETEEPLLIWKLDREHPTKYLSKKAAKEKASQAVASEILRLLTGDVTRDGKRIQQQDIAVLVRSHFEGQLIQRALHDVGILCVRQGQQSVFHTHEALEVERVMRAIANPRRESLVRAALLTDLMGLDIDDLLALQAHASNWDATLLKFHGWHQRWQSSSFMRMFREFLTSEKTLNRLAGLDNGERRMTNLLHLAELIQSVATQHADVPALLNWLSSARLDSTQAQEESLLRLESDEDRVRVVTVHASKGLQYPVVFLPFAWDSKVTDSGKGVFFHDVDSENQSSVDFGTEAVDVHQQRAEIEQLAESVRLLYVSLTRAQSRCYLVWGAATGAPHSALAWLLHREVKNSGPHSLKSLAETFAKVSDEELEQTLEKLAVEAKGAIGVSPIPETQKGSFDLPPDEISVDARIATRPLYRSWQLSSFSSITSGHDSSLPDHDRRYRKSTDDRTTGFFTFPRGPRAGTCLHRIFELIDFSGSPIADYTDTIKQVLVEYGFDTDWTPVVDQMLNDVLRSPLNENGLRLGNVARNSRIDEMAFCIPVDDFDQSGWRRVLQRHALPGGLTPEKMTEAFRYANAQGFLQGFIDLVFEDNGRFYLVDYKSNFLGGEYNDYLSPALTIEMQRSGYTMQYLIYSLALDYWLQSRKPDYQYEQHFGGVFYLFLRGVSPDHNGAGIFFDHPSSALIKDLQHLIGRNS